jgi:hypothetical protein
VGGDGGTDPSKWVIATAAGNPRWSPNGKRLLYVSTNAELFAVDIEDGPAFRTTGPSKRLTGGVPLAQWAVHPNGDRFLVAQTPASSGPPPPFTLVLNWLPRLER